jgi:hypothetical protein
VRNKIESKIEDFFSLSSAALEREYFLLKVLRSQSMRCGSSSHERTTQRREEALRVFVFVHSLGETSSAHRRSDLSRASSQTSIRFWRIRYGRKFASSSKARALCEKNTPTMRSVVLKRKKERAAENTHLNLGGLEAGDGRDLLSSSKHY